MRKEEAEEEMNVRNEGEEKTESDRGTEAVSDEETEGDRIPAGPHVCF